MSFYGATPGSDQDGDTVVAIAEYALGTSPLDSNSVARISLSRPDADGSVKLRLVLPGAGQPDIDYILESSPTVTGPWTEEAMKQGDSPWTGTAAVTTGASEGGYTPVRASFQPGNAPRMFYRLRLVPR